MNSEGNLDKDTIEELKHIVESEKQRGYPSYWHADNESQGAMEVYATKAWVSELNKQDSAPPICKIKKNCKEFPDCVAERDGLRLGIEVTEFTVDEKDRRKYVKNATEGRRVILRSAGSEDGEQKTRVRLEKAEQYQLKVPVPNAQDWPLERFQQKLEKIVETKNKKAHIWDKKGCLDSFDKPLHCTQQSRFYRR